MPDFEINNRIRDVFEWQKKTYGFETQQIFADKIGVSYTTINEIFGQLMYEAREGLSLYCPEFSPERVTANVYELPERIVLDEFWEVQYDVRLGENGLINVPVNIRCLHELHEVTVLTHGPQILALRKESKNTIQQFYNMAFFPALNSQSRIDNFGVNPPHN